MSGVVPCDILYYIHCTVNIVRFISIDDKQGYNMTKCQVEVVTFEVTIISYHLSIQTFV